MKFKSFLTSHKTLITSIGTSACLIGASAGLVFGISAGMFKVEYMTLSGADARMAAYEAHNYESENIDSAWNMNEAKSADGQKIAAVEPPVWFDMKASWNEGAKEWWQAVHPAATKHLWDNYDAMQMNLPEGTTEGYNAHQLRYDYASMVIDGATHATMDRSFNQGLYQALVDFVQNKKCDHCDSETGTDPTKQYVAKSYKPSQDNTTEFINTYVTAIEKNSVLGLAGFNHSTPLTTMMSHAPEGEGLSGLASNPDPKINKACNETAFILLDSNVANNQNVASVQFRSDQPGFLTGLAVCQYFFDNLDLYHDKYQDISVAAFGGVSIPTVTIYIGGFQRGIEFFNHQVLANTLLSGPNFYFELYDEPEPTQVFTYNTYHTFLSLVEHSKYKDEIEAIKAKDIPAIEKVGEYKRNIMTKLGEEFSIKMIKLGGFDTHFSGTFTSGDAIGITKQYLNRGASAIIAVAGAQSLDVAQEIKNQNSKAIVIGVDSAMEDGDYQRYHNGCNESSRVSRNTNDKYVDQSMAPDNSYSEQSNAIIKFSAVKDVKAVSNKIVRLCAEGKNWDVSREGFHPAIPDPNRAICGPGFQTCGNILNGLISISWDGFYPLLHAFRHVVFNTTSGRTNDFDEVWATSCQEYLQRLYRTNRQQYDLIPEEYKGSEPDDPNAGIKKVINLLSYRRTYDADDDQGHHKGDQTVWYQNYNHTIGILGTLFLTSKVMFTPETSLWLNPQTHKIEKLTEQKEMTIKEWLDNNMYMMC